MKILNFINQNSTAKFKIDEYTYPLGSIIFDGSKGGSISNCYFFCFRKLFSEANPYSLDLADKDAREGYICFFIDKETRCFKHVDFVLLEGFKVEKDAIELEKNLIYQTPIIDVSTWVSEYGLLSRAGYEETKYLSIEDHVDVHIIHNGTDTVKLAFGKSERQIRLSDNFFIEIDEFNNITALIIFDEDEVPKLIEQLV